MKKLVLTLAVALMSLVASANNYVANDAAIDALVENSVEMVMEAAAPVAPADMIKLSNSQDPLIATLLSWFTGWCGLHRYYLGTTVWMALPYALTGGGFGVVTLIDAVMLTIDLIQNNSINGQYINNPRILMWADLF
jgi:TM2 domain-containing membrane protein YozV